MAEDIAARFEELLKEVDGEQLVASALAAMSPEDLAAAIGTCRNTRNRNEFLRDLGLPELRKPTINHYRQALQRLTRKNEAFRRKAVPYVSHRILARLDITLSTYQDLLAEQGTSPLELINLSDLLPSNGGLPVGLVRLGLACAVLEGHPLAANALLMLARDPQLREGAWEGSEPALLDAVTTAGAEVVYDDLEGLAAPWDDADDDADAEDAEDAEDAAEASVDSSIDGGGLHDVREDPDKDVTSTGTESQERPEDSGHIGSFLPGDGDFDLEAGLAAELANLAEAVETGDSGHAGRNLGKIHRDLTAVGLDEAREAAQRVCRDLDSGCRPSSKDLAALTSFAVRFDVLAERLEVELGGPLADRSVSGIEAAIKDLAARSDVESRTALLRRLVHVEGPATLASLLSEVRDTALAALEGTLDDTTAASLVALGAIIELAGSDVEQLMALDADARRGLHPNLQPLLMAAAAGRLQLPELHQLEPSQVDRSGSASDDAMASGPASTDANPVITAPLPSPTPDTSAASPFSSAETPEAPDPPASRHVKELADSPPTATEANTPNGAGLDPSQGAGPDAATARRDDRTETAAGGDGAEGTGAFRPVAAPDVTPSAIATAPATDDRAENRGTRSATGVVDAPVEDGRSTWNDADVIRFAAADLITQRRFGLASWLATAAGASDSTTQVLRAAAYADAMRSPTGDCAARLREVAPKISLRDLDEPGIRLVALVSAMRGTLLAPFSGAAQLLQEVAPAFVDHPALHKIAEAIGRGANKGLQIVNVSDAAMASVASLEAEVRECVERAAQTIEVGPNRTVKYQRATEIWQEWIAADGLLGTLLVTVAADRRSERGELAKQVIELRAGKTLERKLTDADRRHRSSSARSTVIAGARMRLLERAFEVLDQVSGWIDAVERLERQLAADGDRTWQLAPVAELREQLQPHKQIALAELERWLTDTDPLAVAAALAATRSLTEAFGIFDGVPLPGEERPAAEVVNVELLKVDDVDLDGLTPLAPPSVAGILAAAAGRDWPEAFEVRQARGDHAGTGFIIDAVRQVDVELATELAERRRVAIARDETDLRAETAAVRDDLARARRQGYLDEDSWSALASRLESVATSTRRTTTASRAELASIGADLEAARAAARERSLERLALLQEASPAVAAVAPRIAGLIAQGHLATADEFLVLAETGEELPASEDDSERLEDFWPSLADGLTACPLNTEAAEAAAAGGRWGPLDFSTLTAGRQALAGRALKAWISLGAGPKAGKYTTALRDVLGLAGIEVDGENRPSELKSTGDRLWLDMVGVTRLGKALVPTFGTLSGGRMGDSLRALFAWGQPSAEHLLEMTSQDTSDRPVLVFYFGVMPAVERRALADIARRRRRAAVAVLDDTVLAFFATRPESRFDTLMRSVLPFTAINPYMPRVAGDVPVEMFYGRADELRDITSQMGTSFIYGGRQLGKSSLLRAAHRRFDNGGNQRAIYVDLKREGIGTARPAEDVWDLLWSHLANVGILAGRYPQKGGPSRVADGIADWLAGRAERRILILLDECDDFLEADAAQKFPTVSRLKGILESTDRRCKPVFAGLHQVQRFQHIPNQPLVHLGKPVSVGPLRPKAAFDLLDRPLRALGYRFSSDELVNRVLAYCNNQPSLIQLFGEALVNGLLQAPVPPGSPPYEITEDDVESAYASRALVEEFRHRFELTLQLDLRYKVIAYAMAYTTHETGPATVVNTFELRHDCERWWPRGFAGMSSDEFRALLGEMVGLGVLAEVDGGYRMRSPNVLRMLGTADQIAEKLLDAEGYELPARFEAASFRRQVAGTPRRSPVSEAQLAELLERRNQCRVVAGSAATGLPQVEDAIKAAVPGGQHLYSVTAVPVRGRSVPATATKTVTGKHRLVIADLTSLDASAAAAVMASARDAVARTAGDTLAIVALSSPRHASMWLDLSAARRGDATDSVSVVELRRWDRPGLRMWMADADLPFQDEDARSALLEVTGGWPVLVDEAMTLITSGDDHRAAPALDAVRARLTTPEVAETFVLATGVPPSGAGNGLGRVWSTLIDLDMAAFRDELADLLAEETDGQAAQHLDVLRMLGALDTTDDGRLVCEPVLATAWRTARGW